MENNSVNQQANIEQGLNKLKDTLQCLEDNVAVNKSSNTSEEMHDSEKTIQTKGKRRELCDLDESHILSSRLRSSSGRVYSNSIVIENANNTTNANAASKQLETVGEQDTDTELEGEAVPYEEKEDSINMSKDCLNGDCCRNTNKIVSMISKLQATVDDIQKTTNRQVRINSNTLADIHKIEDKSKKNSDDIATLKQELNEYKFQLKLVSNVVIRQDQQIATLNKKVAEAQQREMYPNLVISGIDESANENPIQKYNDFVRDQLEIQELIPVHRAYRVGNGASRPLIVELRDPASHKGKIYKHVNKLKGKTNKNGNRFFVADHLPEPMNEGRCRVNDIFAENKKKPKGQKQNMTITKGRLLINEKPYQKAILPPTPSDIFHADDKLMDLADEIDMVKGEEDKKGKCTFVAYAAAVRDHKDISAAYTKVRMKFAYASHIVCAYRLPGAEMHNLEDYADDGKFGAGRTILSVLKERQLKNIVVFMLRFFGGQHLGPVRYDAFRKVTTSALDALHKRIAELNEAEEREKEEKRRKESVPPEHTGWTDEEEEDENVYENWNQNKKEI